MKAFFIETTTSEVPNHRRSFLSLPGTQAIAYIYMHISSKKGWAKGPALDEEIWRAALEYNPDIIVYIGACGGNTPSPYLFERLRSHVAPTVHFCSDAADDPWWPFLEEYERANSFSLQVALDGVREWPLKDKGLSALTPLDPACFPAVPLPHGRRDIAFGFAGNGGSKARINHNSDIRRRLIDEMREFGLQVRIREGDAETYPEFSSFLGRCRMVPNFGHTGSRRHMHVKGRVIETGLAGAMLLEQRGSPTSTWFKRGVEFLEYETGEDARQLVRFFRDAHAETQAMGERLRARIFAEHGPRQFWDRIFDRISLQVPA